MAKKDDNTKGPAGPFTSTRRRFLRNGVLLGATGATSYVSSLPYIGRQSARAAGAPLKFWQMYAPGGQVKSQSAWFEKMVADWNASHDQKVELQYIPHSQYVDGSKLMTSFASGAGPDLFIISPGDFLRYYNGGVLHDLTPFIKEQARADFPKDVIASRMVKGQIHAIPMEVEPMAMYYSVKAFDDAGLNENDIPTTWDDLLELAKKLTTKDRYGVLFETTPGYYQNFTWYPFLWQGGGEFQDKDGKSAFNSKATVQALKFWQDAVKSGAAPRKLLGDGGSDAPSNLGSGYGAMQNIGIWGMSQLDQNKKDFEYGVFKLPIPKGGKYVTVGGGWAFCANSKGANPDAAAEFCAWALASMDKGSIQRVIDWCTVAKSDMPPRQSVLTTDSAFYQKGKMATFSKDIYPGTRAEPRVPPEVYKIISNAIQAAQLGGQDPATQAAQASQQLDAFLASYDGAPIL